MKLQYTKYGSIDMLWSFIPFFPIWTIVPAMLIARPIGNLVQDCELGYEIIKWVSIFMSLVLVSFYIFSFAKGVNDFADKKGRVKNRLFNFLLYILINISGFIIIVGLRNCCKGDGQTALGVIFSGPIASLGLPVMGFVIDVIKSKRTMKKSAQSFNHL